MADDVARALIASVSFPTVQKSRVAEELLQHSEKLAAENRRLRERVRTLEGRH